MISYDAASKMYVAYWMDDYMAVAMPMKGNFEGDKLVFHADAMGPMPATVYTMTPTKNGGSHFEANTVDGKPLLNIDYTRMVAKKVKKKKPMAKKPIMKPTMPASGTPPPATTGGGN